MSKGDVNTLLHDLKEGRLLNERNFEGLDVEA